MVKSDQPLPSEPADTQPIECGSSINYVDAQGFDVSSEAPVAVKLEVGEGQALDRRGGSDLALKRGHRRSRTMSCHPRADRLVVSGPWSLE